MSLENNKSSTINISDTELKNNNNKNANNNNSNNNLNRNMFKFNYVIGKGGFGKVWQVIYKKTKEKYALKEMSKTKIIDKKSQKFINNELNLLKKLRNDFIVNIYYAFQDMDNLYLVIDFLSGGDLRFHVSRYHIFSEEQTRFFISCIIQGLSYIHSKNIIHRDIKPENLVLDSRGYVHITDFGIAKENEKDNSSETSGTPGYMSPEALLKKNHTFSTDFFAIGVIGYEFMKGKRPFVGTKNEIKEKMKDEKFFEEKVKIKEGDKVYKKGWSSECIDFINSLLEIDVNKRLGNKYGIKELKEHQWLKYYMWEEIENKKLEAPFIPDLDRDNFDKIYCKNEDIITERKKKRYKKIMLSEEYKNCFADFYFNKDLIKNNKRPFSKKKIVIDGNIDIKPLKTSRSVKNKMLLDFRKYIFDSSNDNNNKEKNEEIIKEVVEDDSNIKKDNILKFINKDSNRNNNEELYIKKLIIKNSRTRANIKNSPYIHNHNHFKYNSSLSPKTTLKNNNIFLKYYHSNPNANINPHSLLNLNNEKIIKQYNFLNININNIKNKNIYTNSNNPFAKNNSQTHRNIRSKKIIINPKIKMKEIKTVFVPYYGMINYKNKNVRDLFFKKILNPFTKDTKRQNNKIK